MSCFLIFNTVVLRIDHTIPESATIDVTVGKKFDEYVAQKGKMNGGRR